jgi:hypothetical protein
MSREVHGSLATFLSSDESSECKRSLPISKLYEYPYGESPDLVSFSVHLTLELVEVNIVEIDQEVAYNYHTCAALSMMYSTTDESASFLPSLERSSGALSRL